MLTCITAPRSLASVVGGQAVGHLDHQTLNMGTTMSQEALKASRAGDHHGTGLQGLLSLWDTSSLHPAPVFQHLS